MKSEADKSNRVVLLMCTYNPGKFLSRQLESIAQQTYPVEAVWVSDDSPFDETRIDLRKQLAEYGFPTYRVVKGPRRGFAANFLSLICHQEIDGDYFAFCDQDDIWLENKLQVAVDALTRLKIDIPAMYCSRTCLVDEYERDVGLSPMFSRPPSFANALVQSLAGGNTMLLNQAARNLVLSAGEQQVVSHDWWIYQLISGAGGQVVYDPIPRINYRQHNHNLVGANISWGARLTRIKWLLFSNRFKSWNDVNMLALSRVKYLLSAENKVQLDQFISSRKGNLFKRLYYLKRSGVYRQTLAGNLGLLAAVLTGKL